MNRDVWVCSKCGRTTMNSPQATRGWLIASSRDAERAFNGVMVVRCPQHITDYAVRQAEGGRAKIRR